MRPTIAVTGATGSTGAQVVTQLLRLDWPVRAVVRRIDPRADRLRSLGAQVVVADLFDPGQVAAALRGARRAYFCPPTHPHMLDAAILFGITAQEEGVAALVVLSQWLASAAHPSILTRHHFLADRMFASLPDIAHVTVNPGFFADNHAQTIDFAQLGVLPNPMGDSRNAPPSNADIAAVAVGALIDPDTHAGRRYRPTGPALLDAEDMAAMMGTVVGRRVRPLPMPSFLFAKAMRAFGYDEFMTAQTRTYVAEHRRGTFARGGPTDAVDTVAGRPAETFETTVRSYAGRPGARRTPAELARILGTLARAGITPGGNPGRVRRGRETPIPPKPGSPSMTPIGLPPTRFIPPPDPAAARNSHSPGSDPGPSSVRTLSMSSIGPAGAGVRGIGAAVRDFVFAAAYVTYVTTIGLVDRRRSA